MHGIEARRQDEGWWGLLEHVVGQGVEGARSVVRLLEGRAGERQKLKRHSKRAGKIIRKEDREKEKGTTLPLFS